MEQLIKNLPIPVNYDWLICENSDKLSQIIAELSLQLAKLNNPKIIIAEKEPVRFLASFIAAYNIPSHIFLCNPDWGKKEWQEVFNVLQPDIVWGLEKQYQYQYNNSTSETWQINDLANKHKNLIMIPTGGSSGKIKFTIHTWKTLTASVQGMKEYFALDKINSFCILPLYHVSGFMQFFRSFTTGGKLVITSFKELENIKINNIQSQIKAEEFFISLVPTQLQKILENDKLTQWLSQFNTVLLGGAPAWQELLIKARYYQIRLALTYGMTETASQIATLKAEEFLQGKNNNGQILPHAEITINENTGNINIKSQSLTLGYYPQIWENTDTLLVDDIGYLDEENYLYIIGRNSDKIITGGENVYPGEIEAAIRKTNLVIDVCVIGMDDKIWGQAITAIYIPQDKNIDEIEIKNQIKNQLQQEISKFKIPKYWISVPELSRNIQGKINRQELQKIAQEYIMLDPGLL
ncbi:2-succinylbenzoate--CoA ligase [Anabaena sp. FACHB-1237]|uniref:2-succinylbenzoate--CoA ligase n=1 Tax=Anabaena sp. FACHB-1237 TaxID=2692769 RepID=UPI001681A5EA|nr:2-succinylbenzoate--CoA ligase [Anabaena sp. FACHB-1237]MBD2138909.1 2-succinylbenzoate--CoA ligase [Anabaena sp. FACHB-1237]